MDEALRGRLAAAIAARFDDQIEATRRLVAIPSLRGAEGPALDLMADLMRQRGLAVDDWTIAADELRHLAGWGPLETPSAAVRSVVGTRQGTGDGRSLILQGHIDVVPAGPLDMWRHPPFDPVVEGDWMYGRGACDMKSGMIAILCALDALDAVGLTPKGRLHVQSVVEEESTGLGALATLARGYRAEACLIPEPTGGRLNRAQVGVLWFRLRVRGRPAHVAYAGDGANAIMAAYHLLQALHGLELAWNERAKTATHFGDLDHPINFNAGIIKGGDWASSVPAWCDVDCRIAVLPGWSLADCRAEIERTVAEAAKHHDFLREHPPELVWSGFIAEGHSFQNATVEAVVGRAAASVYGVNTVPERIMTGLTDTRFYDLYYGIPAFCFGPSGEWIHGFDERVDLRSVEQLTLFLALFIAEWCGVEAG
ncbi:MAG: ArgE/DapE family deacylase [Geminicoccaceae bacterium]|nr:MAG: ArgE/DapE family deacylase [Geminicoccaceae bacterium]